MGALRQLSGLFLLTASAFTVAIALQDHPTLRRGVEVALPVLRLPSLIPRALAAARPTFVRLRSEIR